MKEEIGGNNALVKEKVEMASKQVKQIKEVKIENLHFFSSLKFKIKKFQSYKVKLKF